MSRVIYWILYWKWKSVLVWLRFAPSSVQKSAAVWVWFAPSQSWKTVRWNICNLGLSVFVKCSLRASFVHRDNQIYLRLLLWKLNVYLEYCVSSVNITCCCSCDRHHFSVTFSELLPDHLEGQWVWKNIRLPGGSLDYHHCLQFAVMTYCTKDTEHKRSCQTSLTALSVLTKWCY